MQAEPMSEQGSAKAPFGGGGTAHPRVNAWRSGEHTESQQRRQVIEEGERWTMRCSENTEIQQATHRREELW